MRRVEDALDLRDPDLPKKHEKEVLYRTLEGYPAKVISKMLGLTVDTVNQYLQVAKEKLGCRTKFEAAVRASRYGLLDGCFDRKRRDLRREVFPAVTRTRLSSVLVRQKIHPSRCTFVEQYDQVDMANSEGVENPSPAFWSGYSSGIVPVQSGVRFRTGVQGAAEIPASGTELAVGRYGYSARCFHMKYNQVFGIGPLIANSRKTEDESEIFHTATQTQSRQ